jgi:AcrR family transcriptional regulator
MPVASEQRRSSAERQTELTDAALRIVAMRGIAALTTRSLAEEVGLTSGALFRHFPSLDALLVAVVARVESVLETTYPSTALAPRERLSAFIDARSRAVGDQLGILRLVVSEQFLLALPEGGSARLGACVAKTRAYVTRCLRDGQAQGVFRADIDAEALALIVMGTVQMLALSNASARKRASEATRMEGALLSLLSPGRSQTPARKSARVPSASRTKASKAAEKSI